MLIDAYRHARLMEESELRVEMAAHSHSPNDILASRILEHPHSYRRWEAEHAQLLRSVSEQARRAHQVTALRTMAFSLVHRRAMFGYLRDEQLTGKKRRRLFGLFYGCRDYTNAVLAEHGKFLRSSSSYLCTQYIAEELMHDVAFDEPLQLYEEWYSEYFRAFCAVELAETPEEQEAAATFDALRPLLKYRLSEAREAILAMPPQSAKQDWRELQIRKANGDTQRMRSIFA